MSLSLSALSLKAHMLEIGIMRLIHSFEVTVHVLTELTDEIGAIHVITMETTCSVAWIERIRVIGKYICI